MKRCVSIVTAAVALAACGGGEGDSAQPVATASEVTMDLDDPAGSAPSSTTDAPAESTSTIAAPTTAPTTTTSPEVSTTVEVVDAGADDEVVDPDECEVEYRTLATASEAYYAANGSYPPDAGYLSDFIREAPEHHEVIDGEVWPLAGCLPTLVVAVVDPDECAAENRMLLVAAEAYRAANGIPAPDTSSVSEFMNEPPEFHEVIDGEVWPLAGCLPRSAADAWLVEGDAAAAVLETIYGEAAFCYTDCTRSFTPSEWAAWAGPFDADTAYETAAFLEAAGGLPELCDEFWVSSDTDIRWLAGEYGVDPNSWVGVLYALCDS